LSGAAVNSRESLVFSVTGYEDGDDYRVRIESYDGDDYDSTTISFKVDKTAPTLSGFATPYIINEGSSLVFDLSATDEIAGLRSYEGEDRNFSGTLNGQSM